MVVQFAGGVVVELPFDWLHEDVGEDLRAKFGWERVEARGESVFVFAGV